MKLAAFLLVYGVMNFFVFKKISEGFEFSTVGNRVFKIILLLGSSLYFIAHFISAIFSADFYHLFYIGFLWIYLIIFLFALVFLASGFFMVSGSGFKRWLTGSLLLVVPVIIYIIKINPWGGQVPPWLDISGRVILAGVFALSILLVYKIIARTVKLSPQKRGMLLIVFCAGAMLKALGINFGMGFLLLGLISVVYVRVSKGLNFSRKKNIILLVIISALVFISLPRLFGWGHGSPEFLDLYYIIGLLNGFFYLAFIFFLLETGCSFFFPSHPKRRVIITLLVLALAYGCAVYNGARFPAVNRLTVPIRKLPDSMSGFTIVQLSDLHLGDVISSSFLQEIVEKTNRLKPDLIVFTGDIFDTVNSGPYIDLLRRLKAKYGILAVTGNHEYKGCFMFDHFLKIADKAGIRVLRNEWVAINQTIQVVGINDPSARRCGYPGLDLKSVMKNIDLQKPIILLSHRPGIFPRAAGEGVDLQLSGHTHGGLFFPLTLVIQLIHKYPYGLYREGDSFIYTSSGTGLYYMPLRLFTRNEIVHITLVSRQKIP